VRISEEYFMLAHIRWHLARCAWTNSDDGPQLRHSELDDELRRIDLSRFNPDSVYR